jgi:hypothetical protein
MPEPLPRRRRDPDPTAALAQVVMKIHRSEPERPTWYLLSVPGQFEGVTLRLWAQKPENRYQPDADLFQDLQRIASVAPSCSLK